MAHGGPHWGAPRSPPAAPGSHQGATPPSRHLQPGTGGIPPPLSPSQERLAALWTLLLVRDLRERLHGTDASPFQQLLPGQHSCFSIKQTLPASSPAGPGNRAADLGHLGTVPPLYLDFGAKFSICEILCEPRQRGHREVGAGPAGPAVLHHRHSPQTGTVCPPKSLQPTEPPHRPPKLPRSSVFRWERRWRHRRTE